MVKFTLALFSVLSIAQQARCWGSLGHRTVAYLAEKYLTAEGSEYLSSLLQQGEDISDAALWADQIRRQLGWGFTAPWHYIGRFTLLSAPLRTAARGHIKKKIKIDPTN